MMNLNSFALAVVVLQLAHVANAGFDTIWVDDMDLNSYDDWNNSIYSYLGFSNLTFWYSYDYIQDKCVTGTCAMQWAGYGDDQILERYTTWDGEYETLRFSFDVVLSSMESGNSCQVWYRLDDDIWVNLASIAPETSNYNEKYYDQSFDIDVSGATSLMIQLYADGDDGESEYDTCFWDNLELSGQRPITTAAPSAMPTANASLPIFMSTSTLSVPDTTMYTSTSSAIDDGDDGDDDDDDDHSDHDHDHDEDDMGAAACFGNMAGLLLGSSFFMY